MNIPSIIVCMKKNSNSAGYVSRENFLTFFSKNPLLAGNCAVMVRLRSGAKTTDSLIYSIDVDRN